MCSGQEIFRRETNTRIESMKCKECGFPLPEDPDYFPAMRTHLEDTHNVVGWRNQKDKIETTV